MKIVDMHVRTFTYPSHIVRDAEGHTHPGPEHEATQSLLTVVTDDGAAGYCFGAPSPRVLEDVIKPAIIGEDPMYRERIWKTLHHWQRMSRDLTDRALGAVDMAIWDLVGRALGQPVYKLLGATRDKVPAYASTMCGDEIAGGLSTPEEYGQFAAQCKERGYPAFKLHTWMPPIAWAPAPKMDIAACAAVREAVGDDMDLMLDCYHFYSRMEALSIGRALEELGYYWLEEPMDEFSTSSYIWLADQLDIPVVGPETADGKMYTRAEWIARGAADISRGGVSDVGGITPLMKVVHLCEAFNVQMEVHGGGPGNLHVLCAMNYPGKYYERGLLHPHIDYEEVEPWLNSKTDPMDAEGNVHVSQEPGLGWDINWDYIDAHTVA